MRVPLVLSALLPLVIVPEAGGWLGVLVGVVTWLVFLIDYVVHVRHTHRFRHTGFGRFDLIVVIFTAPWFLIPGFQAGRFVVLLRLARLARLLIAGPHAPTADPTARPGACSSPSASSSSAASSPTGPSTP